MSVLKIIELKTVEIQFKYADTTWNLNSSTDSKLAVSKLYNCTLLLLNLSIQKRPTSVWEMLWYSEGNTQQSITITKKVNSLNLYSIKIELGKFSFLRLNHATHLFFNNLCKIQQRFKSGFSVQGPMMYEFQFIWTLINRNEW